LTLYSLSILRSALSLDNNTGESKSIKILLVINSVISIGALIYFIYIFSSKSKELKNPIIINYIEPYLLWFLYTIICIIIANVAIYYYLKTSFNDYKLVLFILSFFGIAECVIEIMFLNIINLSLNRITDG
jgi:hypothetical protein